MAKKVVSNAKATKKAPAKSVTAKKAPQAAKSTAKKK